MMRHLKLGSLFLAAAFALPALASATASATSPAFYQCVKAEKVEKKYVGHYLDTKCSKPASEAEIEEGKKNKYELEEWNEAGKGGPSKVKEFKGKGWRPFREIVGFGPIACSKWSMSGEVTGPRTLGHINVTFTAVS